MLPGTISGLRLDDLQDCVDRAGMTDGNPPTCTQVGNTFVPSDAGSSDTGIPSGFFLLFVLAVIVAVGVTVWRVSTARRLAQQSGLDPDLAGQMALMSDDGLDATYLAASLRRPATPDPTPTPVRGTRNPAAHRLTELRGLLDDGLITEAEYAERRAAILGDV